ncbi:FxSxx-COOH system tetratricopeptide repeat protein [Streptomyces sp. P9(2023)]|uniref:FxSxx-COOH system tetratricopeptide repeat protein n=1 Tax=Streptomyces sp. P9(2023) TaxID=3064394 RepID=UPI0028F3E7E1|nr:FxSxx-COOH system tetratricopeptide repeat protein [Streptomyces sp. P9(2023)]MDT9688129.1 FxSxx-COOH system tetratricopeptide repeat protein [Streptomyces sp. P9(2023)]
MAEQRSGGGAAADHGGRAAPEHVLVVFPGYHRPWSAWIGQRLESHGVRTTALRWDPPRESALEDSLGDLLLARGQVLLVLDDWFFQLGPRPAGEWNDVLRGFVAANADRFAAVNLTNRTLLPATAVLEPVSLWGVGEEEAEARLLSRLGIEPRRTAARRIPAGALVRYPETPPDVWGEVPRRNPRFTGRDDLLTKLQERLMDAERGSAACTLLGMSGIGKTQIAAEYAHRFSPDYDVIWWVNSDDRNVQRDRFGELAAELRLPSGNEPGERIRAVREALRRGDPHSRWLIIFDGWDDTDGAGVLLPQGPGHVLITSRNRGWGDHTDILEVPGFDRAESTAYLMRRAPHISGPEADEVAAEFGDVPLPLVQAAAWLGESGMEVPEYLRMVRDGRLSTVDEPSGDGFPNASLTSWSILINRLRRAQPQAIDVLSLCASFAPGRIPLGIVRAYPQAELPEDLRWMVTDLPAWTRALDTLVNYSVLSRESRGPVTNVEVGPHQESVHMHRLVHDIVARLTDGEHREAHRKAVRTLLAEADPGNPMDSRHWPRYAELLPHLEPSGALASRNPRVQTAVLNCLRYCFRSAEFRAGIRLAEKIRDQWSRFMDPVSPEMLELTTQESYILRSFGRFRDAYELDISVRDRLNAAETRDELGSLRSAISIASDLRFLGQYQESERIQRESYAEAQRLLGETEFLTLVAGHNLGVVLRMLGRYREAYDQDVASLARSESVLRTRHAHTLNSSNAVAQDLRLLGNYREALARQEANVRVHVQVLGPQHLQTLYARAQLALCRRREGGFQQDLGATMASLLEQQEQVHGRTHYTALSSINNYANYLREHGDLDHARELSNEAEAGYRALLGPAHPIATGVLANTALVMQAAGERADALAMLEAALAGLTASLGADHPWALGCALNATAARNFNGRVGDAAELSRETLRRARHTLGNEHPLTLSCQVALATDLRGLREVEEAGKLEEDALLTLTRTLGAQHPHTLSARQRNRPYWDFEANLG